MASIDRYRPSREAYQPPTLPPGPPRPDRQSRSPARRLDVPPAVPSPPTHSSRTSPPRPLSQRDARSPQRSRAQSPSGPPPNQWYFTNDEALSTPSVLDGISPAEERLRRAKGVNFIYQAGVLLDLPQITLWVAGVFFHRFYMRYSMVEEKGGIHHYTQTSLPRSKRGTQKAQAEPELTDSVEQNIAATALFLANKTEENCRKTKEIIITVAKVAQKNPKLMIDEMSKEYWRWRDSILAYEELMLELLTFDLMVDNPYQRLFELLGQLDIVHNKHLRQSAWAWCNDACLTSIPLLLEARDVAICAIFFASVHTKNKIEDVNGEPWWKALKGNERKCTRAIDIMQQFYTENPLRKQNPSLPSPAFDLENTRQPRDPMSQDALSSTAGTPFELDRGTQSPRARINGRDDVTNTESGSQATLKEPERANGNGAVSPGKRKEVESDSEGRDQKRARLSDEDEGEVLD
ncbi:Cyclin pch1 [Colletotrichum fructicola]|uniref:Cyclin domain containing protein n=1 Tax=Colletotrichum fructicola (strain Nara gc5) TaxID=1213859 RepID=L2G8F2_COLFN|nr:Cyclin pch1 [Colletotrichum aenigma]KAF4864243.1 Cyclin pch1 [Colletotrichum siamense]KAF4892397.1 Cyclin pch1 [Colletotrichum fructicola]KAF4909799.1 Cyclin pch1 [Colletotrichum fructicola]KAF4933900.1 Cyclin pch1 [Colletotrichum fructicola]KAF5526931.1 Cyclin pch1 [Colletotrichum aenigma]